VFVGLGEYALDDHAQNGLVITATRQADGDAFQERDTLGRGSIAMRSAMLTDGQKPLAIR